MTTPIAPIKLSDLNAEFGGNTPIKLSDYKRGGTFVSSQVLDGPTGTTIKAAGQGANALWDYRGVSKVIPEIWGKYPVYLAAVALNGLNTTVTMDMDNVTFPTGTSATDLNRDRTHDRMPLDTATAAAAVNAGKNIRIGLLPRMDDSNYNRADYDRFWGGLAHQNQTQFATAANGWQAKVSVDSGCPNPYGDAYSWWVIGFGGDLPTMSAYGRFHGMDSGRMVIEVMTSGFVGFPWILNNNGVDGIACGTSAPYTMSSTNQETGETTTWQSSNITHAGFNAWELTPSTNRMFWRGYADDMAYHDGYVTLTLMDGLGRRLHTTLTWDQTQPGLEVNLKSSGGVALVNHPIFVNKTLSSSIAAGTAIQMHSSSATSNDNSYFEAAPFNTSSATYEWVITNCVSTTGGTPNYNAADLFSFTASFSSPVQSAATNTVRVYTKAPGTTGVMRACTLGLKVTMPGGYVVERSYQLSATF